MFGLGFFLAAGYLFSVFYFWDEGGMFLGYLAKGLGPLALAIVSADRMFRY